MLKYVFYMGLGGGAGVQSCIGYKEQWGCDGGVGGWGGGGWGGHAYEK